MPPSARIEAHYFHEKGSFKTDDQLLRNAASIRNLPGVILQSCYEGICPMESAWALHRAWPETDLTITPDYGRSAFDPLNTRALVAACPPPQSGIGFILRGEETNDVAG